MLGGNGHQNEGFSKYCGQLQWWSLVYQVPCSEVNPGPAESSLWVCIERPVRTQRRTAIRPELRTQITIKMAISLNSGRNFFSIPGNKERVWDQLYVLPQDWAWGCPQWSVVSYTGDSWSGITHSSTHFLVPPAFPGFTSDDSSPIPLDYPGPASNVVQLWETCIEKSDVVAVKTKASCWESANNTNICQRNLNCQFACKLFLTPTFCALLDELSSDGDI